MLKAIKNLGSVKELRLFVLCMALLGIGMSLSSPYIALYCTSHLKINTTLYGVLMAISSLSGVAVNSLIARRSDEGMNRKWIIVIGSSFYALLYVSYLTVHNFYFLLVFVALFAGGGATIMPQIFAYSREAIRINPSIDGTFATSIVRSMFSLGFLIGPLIGTLVLAQAGYTGVLASSSGLFVGIGVIVLLFLKHRNIEIGQHVKIEETVSIDKAVIRKGFLAFVLLLVASWMYNLVNPLFIVHTLHAKAYNVGLVSSISAGLEIPIMLWLGALSKRFSNHILILCGTIVGVAYYVFLGFTSSIVLVMIAQVLQATFVAVVFGNGLSYFQDLLPNSPGRAATLYSNASSIGTLMGNLIGGAFSQLVGYRNVYWLCLVLALIAFTVLARQTASLRNKVTTSEKLTL